MYPFIHPLPFSRFLLHFCVFTYQWRWDYVEGFTVQKWNRVLFGMLFVAHYCVARPKRETNREWVRWYGVRSGLGALECLRVITRNDRGCFIGEAWQRCSFSVFFVHSHTCLATHVFTLCFCRSLYPRVYIQLYRSMGYSIWNELIHFRDCSSSPSFDVHRFFSAREALNIPISNDLPKVPQNRFTLVKIFIIFTKRRSSNIFGHFFNWPPFFCCPNFRNPFRFLVSADKYHWLKNIENLKTSEKW